MKKKVLLVGPILTQSGYGEHARMIFRALKDRADLFDLYINPINWGATSWVAEDSEERRYIDFLINKTFAHLQQQLTMIVTGKQVRSIL